MTQSTFSVYKEIKSPDDSIYKLIQLNDTILDIIESGNEPLLIKSSLKTENHMVLCSDNQTWKIRQMNHSNDAFLLNDMALNPLDKKLEPIVPGSSLTERNLLAITQFTYEYELTKTDGFIDIRNLPQYDGTLESLTTGVSISIEELQENSPISKNEFDSTWYTLGGTVLQGKSVVLKPEFITHALSTLVIIMISKNINYSSDEYSINIEKMSQYMVEHDTRLTSEVTNTILHKFGLSENDGQQFKLLNTEVAKWFGKITLNSNRYSRLTVKEFLINWKSSLPEFYNVPIDLDQLLGYYYRPYPDTIAYLDPSKLSTDDLGQRVKELFALTKEWDYNEFVPFVQAYVPIGKKVDSIILKYAKKIRSGKKSFKVTPR